MINLYLTLRFSIFPKDSSDVAVSSLDSVPLVLLLQTVPHHTRANLRKVHVTETENIKMRTILLFNINKDN